MKNGIVEQQQHESVNVKSKRGRSKKNQKRDEYEKYEFKYDTSTVLHIAIQKGNIDIIQLLLSLPQIDLTSKSTSFYKTCDDDDFEEFYLNNKEKSIFL